MKIQKHLTKAALALTGLALMQTGAQAQVTGSDGDLVLAFRDPTNTVTNNLMIDLGTAADFVSFSTANPGVTISLNYPNSGLGFPGYASGYTSYFSGYTGGGLSTMDLSTAYTSSWATLSKPLSWSVFGYSGTHLLGTFTSANAPSDPSSGTRNSVETAVNGMDGSFFGAANMQSAEAANLTQPYTSAVTNSNPTSTDANFGLLSSSIETSVPSTGLVTMDLYNIPANASGGTTGQVDEGTFTLSSNGTFTYTAAGVPEPSTFGLLGLTGVGWLGFLRRRRRAVAA